jgi:membrane-bound lytic murein transglycosylase D
MLKYLIICIFVSGSVFSSYIPRSQYSLNYSPSKDERIAIHFWERIFSQYESHEIVLHDSRNYIIYEVIAIDRAKNNKLSYMEKFRLKRKVSNFYKNKYRAMLHSIYRKLRKKTKLSFDEQIIFDKYKRIRGGNSRFLEAAVRGRLRTQQGQKDEILRAYKRARPYLREIETIFKKNKIPWEITRLPIIESMFQKNARSHAGAVGIWQILRNTGKRYLKYSRGFDPRKHPLKASYAAAKILKHNFRGVKNWPMTILSYNIGRYGAIRAMKRSKTEKIKYIAKNYRHRTFGFSARNYFYELLAIVNVEKNFKAYFGKKLDI